MITLIKVHRKKKDEPFTSKVETLYIVSAQTQAAGDVILRFTNATPTAYVDWSPDGKNLLKITDADGNQTDLFYDQDNNLESVTLPDNSSISYGYSGTLLTSMTDAQNHTTNYTYTDANDYPTPPGLLKSIEDPLGRMTYYEYNDQS